MSQGSMSLTYSWLGPGLLGTIGGLGCVLVVCWLRFGVESTKIVNTTSDDVRIYRGRSIQVPDRWGEVIWRFIMREKTRILIRPKTTKFLLSPQAGNHFFWNIEKSSFVGLEVQTAREIRIFEYGYPISRRWWRISKPREFYKKIDVADTDDLKRRSFHRTKLIEDVADFNALKRHVFSRTKLIDASRTRLEKLKNRVKICTAQCKNLVQTCLEGIEHMTNDTAIGNEDFLWDMFTSKKLRYLIRPLDKLLLILEAIEDLMRTCERRWSRMGLYVSTISFPLSEKKTITKFDILLKELCWNFDIIHYALRKSAALEWDEDKCRYVLQSDSGATSSVATDSGATESGATDSGATASGATDSGASDSGATNPGPSDSGARDVASTDIEPIGTNSLYCKDRAHLSNQVKNESVPSVVVADLVRRIFPTQFGNRHYFASEVLKGSLQEVCEPGQSNGDAAAVPHSFQIDPLHLDIVETLSAGTLKAVHSGKWRGEDVAIGVTKHLGEGSMRDSLKQDSLKEAALILKVQHPNVVEFFGYAFTDNAPPPVSSGKKDAEPVSASYLVMELMQGDLHHEIRSITRKKPGRPFPDDVTVDILLQIVEAMSHMHDCGVIYRDLKAKNCLVNSRLPSSFNSDVGKFYTVKLADFDISKMLDSNASITDHTLMRGTTRLMAPEVWGIGKYVPGATGQKSAYDKSIDVYSFGMTCYEVISGELPFSDCFRDSQLRSALENKKRPVLGVTCPRRLEDLMSRCWSEEPKDRPDFNEIRKVLWTVKYEVAFQ